MDDDVAHADDVTPWYLQMVLLELLGCRLAVSPITANS
jgi:hypothetical protein